MKSTNRSSFASKLLLGALLILPFTALSGETTQQRVHQMSHLVMPFDMSKVLHIFKMTDSGGVLTIVARNPHNTHQIALIRQHLMHEAKRFQNGNYSDPAKLHGSNMPGLHSLENNASNIAIAYSKIAAGARITFTAKTVHLITAIHRWFGAQLSQHGADAKAE